MREMRRSALPGHQVVGSVRRNRRFAQERFLLVGCWEMELTGGDCVGRTLNPCAQLGRKWKKGSDAFEQNDRASPKGSVHVRRERAAGLRGK